MNHPDRAVWDDVLVHLRRQHPAVCRQWFEQIESLGSVDGAFGLRARSNVQRDYLRRECLSAFNEAVQSVTGALMPVRFFGPEDPTPETDDRRPHGASMAGWRAADDGQGGRLSAAPGSQAAENGTLRRGSSPKASGADAGRRRAGASAFRTPGDESGGQDRTDGPVNAQQDGAHTGGGQHDARHGHLADGRHGGRDNQPTAAYPDATADVFRNDGRLGPAAEEVKPFGQKGPFGAGHQGLGRPGYDRHRSSEASYLDSPDTLIINPDNDFEHFVIGPNNRLAHAAAVAVADRPGRAYNPLFIHGGVGLGKTHLLQAVCIRIKERNPGAVMHYVSCDGFMTSFINAVQSGQMEAFRHRYRDVDVLVIDDIHFLAKRDRTQEEFFHTFNSLYQLNKQIILSSDAAPEEIPDLEERLVSRFNWGLVTKVDAPTYETRVEILKAKGKLRGIPINDDVACHIAARIQTNIRDLEGAITKIQIHAQVVEQDTGHAPPINLDLARQALGEAPVRVVKGPSIDAIIETVTDFYGVKRTDVLGKRRQQSISLPRQVCMYLAKKHTRHSLQEIGGYFGGRDHTTVLHAVRAVGKRLEADDDFTPTVQMLEQRLLDVPGRF